jgi:hypothetical protein
VNLAELQRYFAQAATSGSGPLPDLERVFSGSERLSARERLAIYNRSYFYRLLDALGCVFTQTQRLLGEADFERLGLAYVARNPSQHPAVERFGRAFPEYLRLEAMPAVVVDLASLEWARLCALLAANPPHIASVRDIDGARFPRARLRFVPSLQWLELDPRALRAFVGDVPSPSEAPAPRCGVAVWRRGHAVEHEALDATEWRALRAAASDAALNQVCAVFDTGSADDDVQRAFQVLSRWFARQWLESVGYDDAKPPE